MADVTKFFYEIMSDAMDVADLRTDGELEKLLSPDLAISRRSITQYHSGMVVPPFVKRRAILKALDFEIQDSELVIVLKQSRDNARVMKDSFGSGEEKERRTIVLNYTNLLKGYESFEAMEILNNRILELYGSTSNFSAYVTSLVRKDLNEYIITKEDIKE